MPTAHLDTTRIHYEVDGDGLPALVLHGGLGIDHHLYRQTLAPLAERLQLVFYDHRGNGRSDRVPMETITIEQLADDAAALATELGHDRVLAIGHSYGGFVAQELAIRHPERVVGLLLVATTPGQLGAGEVAGEGQGPPMPDDLVALFASEPGDDAAFAALMDAMAPYYLHRTDPAVLRRLFDGTVFDVAASERSMEVLASWSSVDRLASITAPTLLVAGSHDLFTSPPQLHRIAGRVRGAEVVELGGAGHFPWLESPEEFFAAVGAWLDGAGL